MRKALFSILLFSPVFLMAESEPMLETKISSPIVSYSNDVTASLQVCKNRLNEVLDKPIK